MALNSENIKTDVLTIDADPGGTDEIFYRFKAPRDLTILNAYMVSEQTQNAGTAVGLRLENWGTAGTAVEGTVTTQLGGTATNSRLTARTPASATIDSTQDYIEQGAWLVARYTEEGAGWIAGDRFTFVVNWVIGLGA
jgi:hypothetical protein